MNRRWVLALGTATLLVALASIGAYRWVNRDGFTLLETCQRLGPNTTVAALTAALGQPVQREDLKGETWWLFRTPSIMAGPIRARVSERTGRVLALRCREDEAPRWTVPE